MTEQELQSTLQQLLAGWEGECVEFKDANDNFPTSDIGKYFSALSNEANLRGLSSAWLVFGVDNATRRIIVTSYRQDKERLHGLKHQIAQDIEPSMSFREIHELTTPQGRVVLFEIPAAPRGIPIAWKTHYYARNGESLAGLSIAKQDEIRSQSLADDWSAIVCKDATIADLDPDALAKARDVFIQKHGDRIPATTVHSWDDGTFLDKARLINKGKITRATLLLLGRPQSTVFLSPYVAEMSWKLEGPERAYEHFHPPFLLTTSLLFQRIRNLRLTFLPANQLIPVDVSKYDQRIVLEALHNCIAHQDYARCERILVIERQGLVEGCRPHVHVASHIAAATETEAEYLHHKAFDDAYYCDLIVKYLRKFGVAKRDKFNRLLEDKFSDLLTVEQKQKKIQNLLQRLRREGRIKVEGLGPGSIWSLPQ
jgi:ATP-dependent DNA helicase RecG